MTVPFDRAFRFAPAAVAFWQNAAARALTLGTARLKLALPLPKSTSVCERCAFLSLKTTRRWRSF